MDEEPVFVDEAATKNWPARFGPPPSNRVLPLGRAVNTAAQMESSGVPGRIHLAAWTRELLGGDGFEEREVDVNGLGMMRTYLLTDS